MAGEDKVLKVLLQIQSDLQGITSLRSAVDDLKKGLDDTGKSAFSWGDAFKFADAEEALHGVLEGVKAVGEEIVGVLERSVEKAAEIQTEAFPLTALIGNASAAKQVLEGLDSAWQNFGVVSNEALANAARGLLILGTNTDNLMPRLTEITKISLAAGVSLQDVVSAYSRFQTAIMNETEVFTRGMGGFGAATIALLDVLQEHFGKTRDQIQTMLKQGQISLNDLNLAMREATDTGGRFGSVITEMKETFNGAVQAMRTAWEGFEATIGTNILKELTPVVNRITDIEKEFTKIAEDQGWQAAIRIAWEILTDEVAVLFTTGIETAMTKFAPAMAHAFWQGFVSEFNSMPSTSSQWLSHFIGTDFLKGASKGFADTFISGLTEEMQGKKAQLEATLRDLLKPESMEDKAWREAFGGGRPLMPEVPEELGQVQKSSRDVALALKEVEAALQAVHQQQQLIKEDPLLPIDDKQRLLLAAYANEIQNIQAQLVKLTALRSTITDPEKLAELDKAIQKLTFSFDLLGLKLVGLQQPLRADLANWVNSFGDASHQLATTIEGTINAALQGTNQLLLDAAFRTGDWRQTLQGVERQILNLFLTWLEQMALQQAASLLHITTTTSAQVSSGASIAAAHAPAAAATSISSGGLMAILGESAAVAAIIAIMAAFKMHEGGSVIPRRFHSGGGLAEDEVPIIAQEKEIMIRKDIAQPFDNFLLSLNAGDPYAMMLASMFYHSGGGIKRYHDGEKIARYFDPRVGDFVPLPEQMPFPTPEPDEPTTAPYDPRFESPNVTPSPSQTPDPNVFVNRWGSFTPGMNVPLVAPPAVPDVPRDDSFGDWGNTEFGGLRGPFWQNPGFISPWGGPGALQGPTAIPTTFDPQGYPYAVPVLPLDISFYNPTDPVGAEHLGQHLASQHRGGPIAKRFHLGGAVTSALRFHSGGSLSSLGAGAGGARAPQIHIYPLMDRRAIVKDMASRAGQKVIFDVITSRRIDIGI